MFDDVWLCHDVGTMYSWLVDRCGVNLLGRLIEVDGWSIRGQQRGGTGQKYPNKILVGCNIDSNLYRTALISLYMDPQPDRKVDLH